MYRNGLGVAVGAREIRAVLVRGGAIQWKASTPFAGYSALATALRALLSQTPRLPIGTRITLVISPAWVQVKSLLGLPSVKPARLASPLIRENQRAFFLWKGSSALIADVQRLKDGTAWGAAFDREIVDAATQALRAARMVARHVAPTVVAIAAALPNQAIAWNDDDERFVLEGDGDGLRRVERTATGVAHSVTSLPPPLAPLGDDAHRYLDAYAAAVAPRRLPLAWRLQSGEERSRLWARMCHVAMGVGLAGAAAFAAFGPGVRARSFARAADGELAKNRQAQIELARNESELRRVTQILNRVESFRAERGRVTWILGALAQSIPDSTAMLTFHVDSVEGAFTAIAPHVADVLPELEGIREMVGPRIVGSVTREVLGGVHVERASFHFHRSRQVHSVPRRATR